MKTRLVWIVLAALALSTLAFASNPLSSLRIRSLLFQEVNVALGVDLFVNGGRPMLFMDNRVVREFAVMSQLRQPGFWKAAGEAPKAIIVELNTTFRGDRSKLLLMFDVERGYKETTVLDRAVRDAIGRQVDKFKLPEPPRSNGTPFRVSVEDYPGLPDADPRILSGTDLRTVQEIEAMNIQLLNRRAVSVRLDGLTEEEVSATLRVVKETLDVLLNEGAEALARL